jgi:murein peptide amidase A
MATRRARDVVRRTGVVVTGADAVTGDRQPGRARACEDAGVPRRPGLLLLAGALVLVVVPAAPASGAEVHRETVRVGTSVQGRAIVAVHRWTDGATRPMVVIGSMHGDERAGMRVVRRLRAAAMPAGVDLWTIRTMNPDGTAADRRTNADGVDLNRNFPRFWLRSDAGTVKWSGPRAASEPETRAMMRFLTTVRPRTVLIFHQPLHAVDSYRAKSLTLVHRLSRQTGLPVKPLDCGDGCHGTLTDWHNKNLPGRAVTVEFGWTASDQQVSHVARGLLHIATPG